MDSSRTPAAGGAPEADVERRRHGSWLTSAIGAVLVVGVLYAGRDVLIPLAIAILLSFLLSPIVTFLLRMRVPRIAAVVLTATIAFVVIGAFGLLVGTQATQLARDLPSYQGNIAEKLRGFREASPPGGAIDRLTQMFQSLRAEVESEEGDESPAAAEVPVVEIRQPAPSAIEVARDVVGPLIGPIGKAGLVVVLVIFILLEREDLRNRLIRLLGPNLEVTTEVLDEAGYRVSRYLLMQLVVNVTYGIPFGVGLYLIGIPNAALWAVLAVLLRFIPYLGPVLSAAFPLLLAIAVDPGWTTFLLTLGLVLVIELISNNFIEPWLYGTSTSISAVAIILAAIFWTTLWGPIGLLLATPLTVCLAVMGRYFSSLRFLDVMLGSAPALALHERFYQRLLAGDVDEDVRIAEEYLSERTVEELYDEVVLPALGLAAADNQAGRLTGDRRHLVVRSALEVVNELADHDDVLGERESKAAAEGGPAETDRETAEDAGRDSERGAPRVLCAAGRTGFDLAVASMLSQLLERRGFEVRVVTAEALSPEHLASCRIEEFDVVCLSLIQGASTARVQQTLRRLARRAPGKALLVGTWRAADGDPGREMQLPSGAKRVESLRDAVEAVEAATTHKREYAAPATPDDETERLRDIERLQALETRSNRLDELTRNLAGEFRVPISLLNIVDAENQHWRAQSGLPEELQRAGKSPRETSICGHVVAEKDLMIVEDALKDPRFAKNPFLLEHGIRFYAGAPLITRRGHAVGSLCVIDAMPRSVTEEQKVMLRRAAAEAVEELEALACAAPDRPRDDAEGARGTA